MKEGVKMKIERRERRKKVRNWDSGKRGSEWKIGTKEEERTKKKKKKEKEDEY